MAEEETAVLDALLELLVVVALVDVLVAILAGLLEDVLLNVVQQLLDILGNTLQRTRLLLERITAHHLDGAVLQVAGTQHKAYGNSLQLVVGKLKAGTLVVRVVELDADACLTQCFDDGRNSLVDLLQLLGLGGDGDDDHLDRRQTRRQYKTVVVRVGHDECTNESGRDTPRGCPDVFGLVLLIKIGDLESLGEVLTQEVRGSAL